MGTMADQPYLDSAYKLCGYDGEPRMKLSTDKSNLPGLKQIVRQYGDGAAAGDGEATGDTICTWEEAMEPSGNGSVPDGEPLLTCVMRNGERTEAGRPRPLDDIRAYAAEQIQRLPARIRDIDPAESVYPVALSPRLADRRDAVRQSLQRRMKPST